VLADACAWARAALDDTEDAVTDAGDVLTEAERGMVELLRTGSEYDVGPGLAARVLAILDRLAPPLDKTS